MIKITYNPLNRIPMLLDSNNGESVSPKMSMYFSPAEIAAFEKCIRTKDNVDFTEFSNLTAATRPDGISFDAFYCALHNAKLRNFKSFIYQFKNVQLSVSKSALVELIEWMNKFLNREKVMGDFFLAKYIQFETRKPDGSRITVTDVIRDYQAVTRNCNPSEFRKVVDWFDLQQKHCYVFCMDWNDGKNILLNWEFQRELMNFGPADLANFLITKNSNITRKV